MAKAKLYIGKDNLSKVIDGIIENASIVAKTYGYSGHDICLRVDGRNSITNDGVFVSNHIFFEDELKDVGSSLIRGITFNSDLASGDGTTAAAILAKDIILKLQPYLLNKRKQKQINNMLDVKMGMNYAIEDINNILTKNKKDISCQNEKDIYQVAFTATRDKDLSKVLTSAFIKIGKDGRVLYKEKEGEGINVIYRTGFNLDFGYSTTLLPNVLSNPSVLIYTEKMNNTGSLMQIVKVAVEEGKTDIALFVRDGVSDLVMQQIIKIQQSSQINVNFCIINIDENEKKAKQIIRDLSVFTGAKMVDNISVNSLTKDDFGTAKNFNATDKMSTLIDGSFNEEDFNKLLTELQSEYDNNRNEVEKEEIKKRIANLNGQVAIIEIGGLSREKISNYKDKIKDAVGSIKNAVDKGVVLGGGVALLDVYKEIICNKLYKQKHNLNKDMTLGYDIVISALQAPIRQILENSYIKSSKINKQIFNLYKSGIGYNAQSRTVCEDLFNDGIVDPYLTVLNSLKNAVDLCSLFINLEGFISVQSEVV